MWELGWGGPYRSSLTQSKGLTGINAWSRIGIDLSDCWFHCWWLSGDALKAALIWLFSESLPQITLKSWLELKKDFYFIKGLRSFILFYRASYICWARKDFFFIVTLFFTAVRIIINIKERNKWWLVNLGCFQCRLNQTQFRHHCVTSVSHLVGIYFWSSTSRELEV